MLLRRVVVAEAGELKIDVCGCGSVGEVDVERCFCFVEHRTAVASVVAIRGADDRVVEMVDLMGYSENPYALPLTVFIPIGFRSPSSFVCSRSRYTSSGKHPRDIGLSCECEEILVVAIVGFSVCKVEVFVFGAVECESVFSDLHLLFVGHVVVVDGDDAGGDGPEPGLDGDGGPELEVVGCRYWGGDPVVQGVIC